MTPNDTPSRPEREDTDESLRLEREKADHAIEEQLATVDETADAVISLARSRADSVLAAARARTDREAKAAGTSPQSIKIIAKERVIEDQVLQEERAGADEAVRDEREEKVSLLAAERLETDKDLDSERARSDDSLATRDEFLGIVSHDLRNMLNGIVGFAAVIAEEVTRGDHIDHVLMHTRRIQRSGARMNRLIGDLVDVASIEAGSLAVTREPSDPVQVVMEAVDTFQTQARASGVTLGAEVVPPFPPAAFDQARILQVLSNLLSNAIKFSPNGKVVVRVERIEDDLRFSVSDTGVGIPPDKLEAVFLRFLQITKNDRRGVGLGLYISNCIVQGHGGNIWAESTIGKGTTVYFTLPLTA